MAKHAKHARESEIVEVEVSQIAEEAAALDSSSDDDMATGHSPDFVNIPPAAQHKRKSRRMRIVLIAVSAVLVALLAALAYFAFMLVNEASDVAYETASRSVPKDEPATPTDSKKADVQKHGDIPDLTGMLGLTVDEAIDQVGRGATITSEKDIEETTGEDEDEETKVVGKNVTVALADETTDKKGNTPSVYLKCNEEGIIVQVGYSASVSSLNYDEVSFADIVQTEHIVENLLNDAGVSAQVGSVELPAADDYRVMADDGTTIAEESYTFTGEGQAGDGATHTWSCHLIYDYLAANVSGNLADTIKLVYLYIDAA